MNVQLMGKTVKPFGKIVAVGIRDGEPYVMLLDKHKVVSLTPMQAIEAHIQLNSAHDARFPPAPTSVTPGK